MSGPKITIARKTGAAALAKRMLGLGKLAAYVGVPASTSKERSNQLLGMAAKTSNKKKKAYLEKAAKSDINNAELLFVFSKGSPARKQPPRDVLDPSIKADGNKQPIANELAQAAKAQMHGDKPAALKRTQRAALAGQNAARGWFTDSRNGWAPLADSTKRARLRRMSGGMRKKAEALGDAAFTIGVDTGAMRAAIQGIVSEE